ncbi:MAG: hypothetical protein JWQ91_737 [Aeromicrobium sp.]|uniref:hypothetical protein n=1 Tax=Aeromicrobium sp. TaxID=1871063 RepID=UPI00261345B1|nr:hypothetical protein [Aeromicrobium sp.]MCW2788452.1 hypothetical protein [Aeromicrobium sp.]MCW2823820.1 hypothetical protein [Aeromicrobium sp.]
MSQRRLPAEVYWRRRLFVLAAVIALVWAVLQVVGGGDDTDKAAAKPTATPTAAATVAQTTKTDGIVEVALVSASKPCDPEKIRITPSVRPRQTTKAAVDIGLVVSSTSRTACTLAPDDADLLAVISANGTPIWDSTVCKSSLLDEKVAISPQWSTLATVQWTGRGSGSKCSQKEGWASPGTYTVQVGTLGGEPGRTTFSIKPKPEPRASKSTPTPEPTESTKAPSKPKTTTEPAD